MRNAAIIAILTGGVAVALIACVWPALALAPLAAETDGREVLLGERRVALLVRGVRVAALSAAGAAVLGAALASGFVAARPRFVRLIAYWAALLTLLTPPYLYAYAWSLMLLPGGLLSAAPGAHLLPAWAVHEGRAICCLATWLAPVAAAVLAAGWRLAGRPAFRMALVDAGGGRAMWRAGIPVMTPWLLVALLITFVLATTEFSVCHLCQVQTLNTEILAEFQSSPGAALTLAWPLVALNVGMLGLGWLGRRRMGAWLTALSELRSAEDDLGGSVGRARLRERGPLVAALLVLSAPWLVMLLELREWAAFGRLAHTFPHAWEIGLLQAVVAALAAGVLALAVEAAGTAMETARPWLRVIARISAGGVTALLLAWAMLPPALTGIAFVRAYAHVPAIYDHFGIVALANVARFGVLAVVATRLAARTESDGLIQAARADGAGWAACCAIRLARVVRSWTAVCLVVGLLALTEVAASTLVNPPGVPSLALTLLNHVHFGRNDDVIALSLTVFAVLAGAAAALLRFRRR